MTVRYEWIVEIVDEGSEDIISTEAWDTAADALRLMREPPPEACRYDWGLCRDAYYPNDSRSWAYVEDGKLPEYFEDAGSTRIAKVPRRYVEELARALADER